MVAGLHYNRFGPRARAWVLGVRIAVAWWGASDEAHVAGSLAVSCVLLLVAELIGRFLFYASHRRIGL